MKFACFTALAGFASGILGQTLPLHTSSRWILDANNQRVKLRCINWAAHMETNLPEGLHKQSIAYLADWIKAQGFNCVRLTFSIEHALNPHVNVSEAFTSAAAPQRVSIEAMTGIYGYAAWRNPFMASTTVRGVWDAVVTALWDRKIMTILDNHVSKAGWCCNLEDGNGWWDKDLVYLEQNSKYFKTDDWLRGLEAMATWAKQHPGIIGMGLRNEIRELIPQGADGRDAWYRHIYEGGRRVHIANPDLLIIVGGTQSSTDLIHMRTRPLDTSAWPNKNVWEFHAYEWTPTYTNYFLNICSVSKTAMGLFNGFVLEQGKATTGPLMLSEFGAAMLGGPKAGLSDKADNYLNCLISYMQDNDAEWALWAIQGSYYARDGQTDYDEGWGAMNRDWSDWRNPEFPKRLGLMFQQRQGP